MFELLQNIWTVFLDTAFWLLLGLLAAGFIKSYISEDTMRRWVGGSGFAAVSRAALFGAPLPLCSCGVLPAAIGLHRSGASKEATVSFLISTPETSVDSIAVTYALMGPVMAVYRPVAALVSAVGTGLMTTLATGGPCRQVAASTRLLLQPGTGVCKKFLLCRECRSRARAELLCNGTGNIRQTEPVVNCIQVCSLRVAGRYRRLDGCWHRDRRRDVDLYTA